MAHVQQRDFCLSVKGKFPDFFRGKFVLDVGSLDINGNNQFLFDRCAYIGVDLMPGRNVDIASLAHELKLPDSTFDVIISTECFEHDPSYQDTILNIVRMLKPGGLFVFSCATTGRPEHGTRRTTPDDAPFTQAFGDWGDYYMNLEEKDIRGFLDVEQTFKCHAFSSQHATHDLYFWGLKSGEFAERSDYSFRLPDSTFVLLSDKVYELEEAKRQAADDLGQARQQLQLARTEIDELRRSTREDEEARRQAADDLGQARQQHQLARTEIDELRRSKSWRVTMPLRWLGRIVRTGFRAGHAGGRRATGGALRAAGMPRIGPDRLWDLARIVYQKLPLPQAMKLRLRERLAPLVSAVEADRRVGRLAGGTLSPIVHPRTAAAPAKRDAGREIALASILEAMAAHARMYGPMRHWIALPFLSTGGAEMVALNLCRALRELRPDQSILLLTTDRPLVSKRMVVPSGVLMLRMDDYLAGDLSYARKQALLRELLTAARPSCFHNINSEVAWHLLLEEGERLQRFTRLFASIFAFQFASDGVGKVGYAAYFLKKGMPYLSGLLSDNARFVVDAAREYELTPQERSRMSVLYQPCRVLTGDGGKEGRRRLERRQAHLKTVGLTQTKGRPQVLWAGRLDAEKRIDLFLDVVRYCTFADFRVFGQVVLADGQALPELPNLTYEGPFTSPLEWLERFDFDAFIFTSRWEGMPNIVIEVGALGIPVIAPIVGGIGELITDATGYPLPERPTVGDYARTLRDIVGDPTSALQRAEQLFDLVLNRHSWGNFITTVAAVPNYLGEAGRVGDVVSAQETDGECRPLVSVVIPCFNQGRYLPEFDPVCAGFLPASPRDHRDR